MSEINCTACSDLRETSPEFVVNGTTEDICASLQNDTGLNSSLTVLHDDETDLHTANDCLIGMDISKIESYEVCDWKEFMRNHLKNLYELLKGIICAIGGIWKFIHKHDCQIQNLYDGINFEIGETTEGDAYVVAGKGVSFAQADGSEPNKSDVSLTYIAGGLVIGVGSFVFHTENFTDSVSVGNFDNGSTYSRSQNRLGNSVWGTIGKPASGGELICEIRIKNSAFPQIKRLYSGFGMETAGGSYHVLANVHMTAGHYAPGQHGNCNPITGVGYDASYDNGHVVPSGWTYVQIRMSYMDDFNVGTGGHQYSPKWFMGIRTNRDKVEC